MEPTPEESLLTAYLDGEISPQDKQLLEQRLAEESELRERLSELEETWHYLDLLERENADAEKIETTMRVTAISMSAIPLLPPKIRWFSEWSAFFLACALLLMTSFYLGKSGYNLPLHFGIGTFDIDKECTRLAETLGKMPPFEQERLLTEEPLQIINELKQLPL